MPEDPTLVVFCRRPALGVGKQRLANALGAAVAHDIAQALLMCALEDAAQWPGPVALAPSEIADVGWAAGLLPRAAVVVAQAAGNLGERLAGVDGLLRSGGQRRLLFIGTDSPAHGAALYEAACSALDFADVVLAPAQDGGVTLMGARRAWPPLADLPWSTATLGAALLQRCREQKMTVHTITASFDVDEPGDLALAERLLASDPRPARRHLLAVLAAQRASVTQ